jgi:3-phosphoshikimate 1-carboxyvinyltransferase
LVVHGAPDRRFRAADVVSAGDHRIAMSAAIGGLAADRESTVRDVHNVATSFPTFVEVMRKLGVALA